ncbi:MAG TPA: twin-arginine translocase TatA/TatE family subunit [Brumimicrobium sp.]|nr:twin-arginine translocase TatA/TatE family subunit [Brumimicrobium sp.]
MLLFINSIAGSEIIVILLFVLIFFGAKSIPGMARGLGKGMRQIKDASQDIQDEIRKTTTDMKRDVNINRALHDAKNSIESPIKEFTKDLKQSATEVSKSIEGETEKTKIEAPLESPVESSVESPIQISEVTNEDVAIKPNQQTNL